MKKLFVVGIGPGGGKGLTREAEAALDAAEVFCGYPVYIGLLRPMWPDTPALTTPMTRELERCHMALESAAKGRTTAMVCSGDAGVYGMAGPVLELSPRYPEVEVEVLPGVTAALGGAALLGAPLMNDFAVVSLSDLLTPWETIEKRLRGAALADFSVCLYNPVSRRRAGHLRRACEILLESKSPETVCGWVKKIGREGQEHRLCTLKELSGEPVDMFTTVFVGNSSTRAVGGRMVTPRGYETK